jgi:hypothetical protein
VPWRQVLDLFDVLDRPAKSHGVGSLHFCDDEEFGRPVMLYGSGTQLQTPGDLDAR